MTPENAREGFRRPRTPRPRTPRLRLKPKASCRGPVDGAWWPRSDDLAAELPDLIAVLSSRLGAVEAVAYDGDEWLEAPAEFIAGGRLVHLDGRRRSPGTLEVHGANRGKIVLLVVPPQTQADQAHAIVMAAAAPHDASSADTLLMISDRARTNRTRHTAAQDRWNSPADRPAATP